MNNNMEILDSELSLLSDAINLVPEFNGKNITLKKFLDKCESALLMLPEELEEDLVRLLRKKLIKEAKKLINEIDFEYYDDFVCYMEKTFALPYPLQQLENKLNQIYQKNNEKVYDYTRRIFDSRNAIINSYKNLNDNIFCEHKYLTDLILLEAFLNGLEFEISNQIKIAKNIDDVIDEAIHIERKLLLKKILKQKVEHLEIQKSAFGNFKQEKQIVNHSKEGNGNFINKDSNRDVEIGTSIRKTNCNSNETKTQIENIKVKTVNSKETNKISNDLIKIQIDTENEKFIKIMNPNIFVEIGDNQICLNKIENEHKNQKSREMKSTAENFVEQEVNENLVNMTAGNFGKPRETIDNKNNKIKITTESLVKNKMKQNKMIIKKTCSNNNIKLVGNLAKRKDSFSGDNNDKMYFDIIFDEKVIKLKEIPVNKIIKIDKIKKEDGIFKETLNEEPSYKNKTRTGNNNFEGNISETKIQTKRSSEVKNVVGKIVKVENSINQVQILAGKSVKKRDNDNKKSITIDKDKGKCIVQKVHDNIAGGKPKNLKGIGKHRNLKKMKNCDEIVNNNGKGIHEKLKRNKINKRNNGKTGNLEKKFIKKEDNNRMNKRRSIQIVDSVIKIVKKGNKNVANIKRNNVPIKNNDKKIYKHFCGKVKRRNRIFIKNKNGIEKLMSKSETVRESIENQVYGIVNNGNKFQNNKTLKETNEGNNNKFSKSKDNLICKEKKEKSVIKYSFINPEKFKEDNIVRKTIIRVTGILEIACIYFKIIWNLLRICVATVLPLIFYLGIVLLVLLCQINEFFLEIIWLCNWIFVHIIQYYGEIILGEGKELQGKLNENFTILKIENKNDYRPAIYKPPDKYFELLI